MAVVFIWKARTLQHIKVVANKVYRSIVADPVPLIRRAISAIMLPIFQRLVRVCP